MVICCCFGDKGLALAGLGDISIIGPGKVGTALGMLACRAGLNVVAVGGRRKDRAALAAEAMGAGVKPCTPAEAAAAGQVVLLTVSDEAIGGLCADLAGQEAFQNGAVVAHCSGVLASDVLAPAKARCGCAVGSMHPLQTFPTVPSAVANLPGAICFIEGDPPAVAALEALAKAIGAESAGIDARGKALYHAAAVMACNYVVSLLEAAEQLMRQAGIDGQTARKALGPLVRASIANVARLGPAEALTGPIARGDTETVRRHLAALAGNDELSAFYRAAAVWTIDLARRKGTLTDASAKTLGEMLTSHDSRQQKE